MKSTKKTIGIVAAVVSLLIVAVTFVRVVSSNSTGQVEIRLAHNQSKGSEIADSIAKFSEFAAEDPDMNIKVDIYASGVLGSEKEAIEEMRNSSSFKPDPTRDDRALFEKESKYF